MESANTLYKKSNTTLSFKEWIEREKAKNKFIPNKPAINEYLNADGDGESIGAKEEDKGDEKKVLMKNIVVATLMVVGVVVLWKAVKSQ